MDNNSIDPNEVATLSLLGRGGYGGYGNNGGLYAGNQVLAADAHANGTAVNNNILANRQATENGFDCSQKLSALGLSGINSSFENQVRSSQFNELSREHTDLERRVNDQNAALIATINDSRAEAAKCCCDAKLEACKNTSAILAAQAANTNKILTAISTQTSDELREKLANANLKAAIAEGHHHHNG